MRKGTERKGDNVKKVYCENCKWAQSFVGDGYWLPLIEGRCNAGQELKDGPHHCPYYKRKWWKSWTKEAADEQE